MALLRFETDVTVGCLMDEIAWGPMSLRRCARARLGPLQDCAARHPDPTGRKVAQRDLILDRPSSLSRRSPSEFRAVVGPVRIATRYASARCRVPPKRRSNPTRRPARVRLPRSETLAVSMGSDDRRQRERIVKERRGQGRPHTKLATGVAIARRAQVTAGNVCSLLLFGVVVEKLVVGLHPCGVAVKRRPPKQSSA